MKRDAEADAHIGISGYVVSSPAVATVAVAAPVVAVATHSVDQPTCTSATERVCKKVESTMLVTMLSQSQLKLTFITTRMTTISQVPVESSHKVARKVSLT